MNPVVIVVFGASGDLAQRKLMPALLGLYRAKELPEQFTIIGFGRKELSGEQFKALFFSLYTDPAWKHFAEHLSYVQGAYNEAKGYALLATLAQQPCDMVFYLSTPPETYADIVCQLKLASLSTEQNGFRRIVVEKPFGHDLVSAQQLNSVLAQVFRKEQIFPIDHYLGKAFVQEVHALRAHYGKRWNNAQVDHVQITAAEDLGLEGRGGYYDAAGALRDMIQSHLLQVLALVAMEQPVVAGAGHVQAAKLRVLEKLYVDAAVRGQYIAGKTAAGYLEELGKQNSLTETFVALKLGIENARWQGVPFYVRMGKRMPARFAEVVLVFKDGSKQTLVVNPRSKPSSSHEPHEVLVRAVLQNDHALFPSWEEIEHEWKVVDSIHELWQREKTMLASYPAGTWGPREADELIKRDGRSWSNEV
jgi:glucose-6-phosphate 1-dehydrogenase